MTHADFTPALGRIAPTRFYDHVVTLTRERLWRALVSAYVAPRSEDVIVDIGCGTGSLALLLNRVQPRARITGLDPDPDALSLARRKSTGTTVRWETCGGSELQDVFGPGSVDTVVSSLVLHQCPVAVKYAILESAFTVLRPGGRIVIADYGRQRTSLMRLAFLTVQLADGHPDTQPNADGVLPGLMAAAGFQDVCETEQVSTLTGSISLYVGRKTSPTREGTPSLCGSGQ